MPQDDAAAAGSVAELVRQRDAAVASAAQVQFQAAEAWVQAAAAKSACCKVVSAWEPKNSL